MSDNLDLFVGPPADCPFCGAEHINDLARNAYRIHHEEGCYFEKVFGGTHAIHFFTHYDDRIPFWNKRSNVELTSAEKSFPFERMRANDSPWRLVQLMVARPL